MRRALTLTTALAASAALAACGGDDRGGDAAPAKSPRDRALDGALAFARCMRANGVDMPDPKVGDGGMIQLGPGPGAGAGGGERQPLRPDSAAFQKAEKACRKHLKAGARDRDPEEVAKARDAFVKYAECMRGEGIDMPDPSPDGGFRIRRGERPGLDLNSPAFRAADGACRKHLAALDGPLGAASGDAP